MALPHAANRGKMNGVLNLPESRKRGYQNRTGCGIIKTDEPRTLDFSGVRGFLVTNVCIVQRSAA